MEEPKSEFNSSLQYLWQINNLIWSACTASIDDDNSKDEFRILHLLDVLLDPRMTEQERWEASVLSSKAMKGYDYSKIRDYFIYLNRIAHSKGLILKDKDTLPAVIRNTV